MKKFFSLILFSIFLFTLHAIPYDNINEYTLENGLTVFVLEDTSTPLIRIEYTARAGFSNQTKETSGFLSFIPGFLKQQALLNLKQPNAMPIHRDMS